MLSMDVVFTQILVIMLYVLVGFVAVKSRLVDPDQRKYLTRVCANLIMPFTVLSAASQTITRQDAANLGLAAAMMLGIYILTTAVSLKVQSTRGVPTPVKVTTAALVTYPNCTFLGLPLTLALFGERAILYNAMCMIAFNVLFFTWQATLFTGKKFDLRNLATPATIATVILIPMLGLGIHFPAPLETVVKSIGAMTSPLSLIIIGVMMSENPITAILHERRAYVITLLRNLALPLLGLPVLLLMPFDPSMRLCFLVYMGCPCAALTTIYAIQNDMEPELAARTVLMSTLFFAVTLPAILFIGMRVLG